MHHTHLQEEVWRETIVIAMNLDPIPQVSRATFNNYTNGPKPIPKASLVTKTRSKLFIFVRINLI